MGWNCYECGGRLRPLHLTGWPENYVYFGIYKVTPNECPTCGAVYLAVFDSGSCEDRNYVALTRLDRDRAGLPLVRSPEVPP